MLLSITTTHQPATDLGYLLHKNPAAVQSFELPFGMAHVFYPEASEARCTASLLVELDPVGLVRDRRGPSGEGGRFDQYVNDRPYAASSFLSVALARVFRSALKGSTKERPELAAAAIPLEARLPVVPSRGGEGLLRHLFEPLGYEVEAERLPLDETFPEWGVSPYYRLTLRSEKRLSELLTHLYVLIPVLDDEKHYWVGDEEVEKLLRHGGDWLGAHPARELIAQRYLKRRRSLVRDALERLVEEEAAEPAAEEPKRGSAEAAAEETLSLNQQRLGAVHAALRASGAASVIDLGCGEGRLLRILFEDRRFERIVGLDVSYRTLEMAQDKLRLEQLSPARRARIELLHGSLMYRDRRLEGFDAAAVVEVVEHLDPPRLAAFERVLFELARPRTVVLTTPNREYNVRWPSLPAGRFRHEDHRFEWTRGEFQEWARAQAERFGYTVRFEPVGPDDPEVGPPTQMAIFGRAE
ncbi:MAG: 3' terminal RNA ribose 2'-O-methyltransferase Hen1 [Armatimonadota bacterium]